MRVMSHPVRLKKKNEDLKILKNFVFYLLTYTLHLAMFLSVFPFAFTL